MAAIETLHPVEVMTGAAGGGGGMAPAAAAPATREAVTATVSASAAEEQAQIRQLEQGATSLVAKPASIRLLSLRLLRLAEFRRAEIDFEGIAEVGHSFADELFRVFAAEQPALELVPLGMSPRVAEMLASVRAAA